MTGTSVHLILLMSCVTMCNTINLVVYLWQTCELLKSFLSNYTCQDTYICVQLLTVTWVVCAVTTKPCITKQSLLLLIFSD